MNKIFFLCCEQLFKYFEEILCSKWIFLSFLCRTENLNCIFWKHLKVILFVNTVQTLKNIVPFCWRKLFDILYNQLGIKYIRRVFEKLLPFNLLLLCKKLKSRNLNYIFELIESRLKIFEEEFLKVYFVYSDIALYPA